MSYHYFLIEPKLFGPRTQEESQNTRDVMSFLRSPLFSLATNLSALGAATYYIHQQQVYHLEENEARADEIEGTFRGHIGYIEDALDRLEGKADKNNPTKKMSVCFAVSYVT